MRAQPVHYGDSGAPSIPRTQNGVAEALPPADRMEFYREMGQADEHELLGVLRRWWMRAMMYADPLAEPVRTAIETGTAPGRPAAAVLHEAQAAREADSR
ncbi:hypothetical protein [Streptomyces hesseae]|uniref:Uncharacterized protein n=1 Tax=Streptomyces hesseae TaxID=3075519 RepID=A0ABU2SXC9_9ACTN|nr:hypothetical protein [Streptomyces sp. DSM 40473]MDT0453654.1 hypothetical protein [Streptomyces sp. DSM 40473]